MIGAAMRPPMPVEVAVLAFFEAHAAHSARYVGR